MVVTLALLVAAFLAGVDFATGHEISISALYVGPIAWVCWMSGRRAALLVAGATSVMWFMADLATEYEYGHRAIPFWNAFMLLLMFVAIVYLLSGFQAAHRHLEETVRVRTEALKREMAERKRLEVAKLQAERLAVVGRMAAEVAHEIRNPLGAIALNLDLMKKEMERISQTPGHSPEDGRTLAVEMRTEIHRIQKVLEDYLQFARLPKPQRTPVQLNALLGEKLAFMHGVFDNAGVKLRTRFDPALRLVEADAEQIWQAALNLIRNGLDAMPAGGEMTVSTQCEGGFVHLRVADTGRGMSAENLEHVFRPFFTTKAKGSGLGLSLVQQIATEHGGHAECESTMGVGSAFTICLRLSSPS